RPDDPAVSPTAERGRSAEAVDPQFRRQPAPAAKKPPTPPIGLLTAFRLLSGTVHADPDRQFVPVPRKPPALPIELLSAFRQLSGMVQADLAKHVPPAVRARPDDHAVLVEASQIDVASAIRAIDGVQRVTRQIDGFWLVSSDRDIRPSVARQII